MTKSILITGASSGIGAATARALLARGHQVAVTGRDKHKLDDFATEAGDRDRLLGIVADAADWEATRDAVEQTVDRFGGLDVAIANAGFSTADNMGPAALGEGDPALWRAMVLTNVLGPALLTRAALPHLEASGGRLVFIGSVAGLKNAPGNLYSATKWAVTGLAENARMYATTRGIGVTLVNPGVVDTPFWQGSSAQVALSARAHLSADPIAEAICFAIDQPAGVDLNTVTIRPVGQQI
jgi:NADP-dependent 3-hydroxy acid dehydrogenase YdfG